jgi:hypothetical protein
MTVLWMICLTLSSPVTAKGSQSPSDSWNIYTNAKYGYEVRHPDGFEVLLTGPEGLRDGAAIRIARKEYAAPAPVLDVYIGNAATTPKALPIEAPPPDIDVVVSDAVVGGLRARQVVYRWKANREIVLLEIRNSQVVFMFESGAGLLDFSNTVWWNVIQTFRFLNK